MHTFKCLPCRPSPPAVRQAKAHHPPPGPQGLPPPESPRAHPQLAQSSACRHQPCASAARPPRGWRSCPRIRCARARRWARPPCQPRGYGRGPARRPSLPCPGGSRPLCRWSGRAGHRPPRRRRRRPPPPAGRQSPLPPARRVHRSGLGQAAAPRPHLRSKGGGSGRATGPACCANPSGTQAAPAAPHLGPAVSDLFSTLRPHWRAASRRPGRQPASPRPSRQR
eukprot:scaffold62465_cov110-Phaeocystis_antarctica.AAC.1